MERFFYVFPCVLFSLIVICVALVFCQFVVVREVVFV